MFYVDFWYLISDAVFRPSQDEDSLVYGDTKGYGV